MLTAVSPDPDTCPYGGTQIDAGIDLDDDEILDGNEITTTEYTCSGAPGATVVTAATKQALSNRSYEADSNSLVTFTLPPSPAVGDLVWISGAGTGGWSVEPSAGQSIAPGTLAAGGVPGNWQASVDAGNAYWNPITMDYSGQIVFAANNNGILKSTDGGVTFDVSYNHPDNWRGVSTNPDGTIVYASNNAGSIVRSLDGGQSWNVVANFAALVESIDLSADGQVVFAANHSAAPRLSTDGGQTFGAITGIPAGNTWVTVSVSEDGQKLLASQNATLATPATIYSEDGGTSWTSLPVPAKVFSAALSGDGTIMYALSSSAGGANSLHVSTNSGANWTTLYTPSTASVPNGVLRLSVSYDGQGVAIGTYDGHYHATRDGGANWSEGATRALWYGAAVSGNGARFGFGDQANGPYHYNDQASAASVDGGQFESVTLRYAGSGQWDVVDSTGNVLAQY